MTSLLTTCHIRHVCWHYKSVYFIVTCHRQRSTKLSTTYGNVWTRAFWRVLDILRILCILYYFTFVILFILYYSRLIWHNFVKVGDNCIKICNLAYIRTYNRCVKNRLKILNSLWKKIKNSHDLRVFFDSRCRTYSAPSGKEGEGRREECAAYRARNVAK